MNLQDQTYTEVVKAAKHFLEIKHFCFFLFFQQTHSYTGAQVHFDEPIQHNKTHWFSNESEHLSIWSMYKTQWHIQKEETAQLHRINCNFGLLTVAAPLSKCALLVWRVEVPTDCLDDGGIGMRSTISTIRWLIKCTKCFIVCSVLLLINYFSRTHCLKCNSYFKVFVWFYY